MKANNKRGIAIYQPKGAAYEYCHWACNLYNGCSNKCDYCYNRKGVGAGTLGKDIPELKKSLVNEEEAYRIFCRELDMYEEQIKADGNELFFSFVSDPMLPETRDLTLKCAYYAADKGIDIRMLTKCTYPKIEERYKEQFKLGFTITGMDEMEHSKYINGARMFELQRLHEQGYFTWISCEPIIDADRVGRFIASLLPYTNEVRFGLASHIGANYNQEYISFLHHYITVMAERYGTKIIFKHSFDKYIIK